MSTYVKSTSFFTFFMLSVAILSISVSTAYGADPYYLIDELATASSGDTITTYYDEQCGPLDIPAGVTVNATGTDIVDCDSNGTPYIILNTSSAASTTVLNGPTVTSAGNAIEVKGTGYGQLNNMTVSCTSGNCVSIINSADVQLDNTDINSSSSSTAAIDSSSTGFLTITGT